MTIYWTSLQFSIVGPRSRLRMQIRKNWHDSNAFYELISIELQININYDNIWDKFAFQHCRSKMEITVTYGGGIHHL